MFLDDHYILKLGQNNEFRLSINVSNVDEPAYEAQVFVIHHPDVKFISVTNVI